MVIEAYQKMKEKGLAILTKVGPGMVILATPQYDSLTGEQKDQPNIENFNLKAIDEQIASFEKQIASLKLFRADVVKALEV
jgi:hypothetical protein